MTPTSYPESGLLMVGSGDRQDGLDISGYPEEMAVHLILSDCAARADGAPQGYKFASM